jgi:hypothetical protein
VVAGDVTSGLRPLVPAPEPQRYVVKNVTDTLMNPGFRDLAAGAFESGLAKLDADPEWHDDRLDL